MADRFTRDKLDPIGQKLYDQLKEQKEGITPNIEADQAKRLYGSIPNLGEDETLAFMAERLRDSGLTDIYKIKKQEGVQQVPIQYGEIESAGEGMSRDGYYYLDPRTKEIVEVSPSQVKDFQAAIPGGYFDSGEGVGEYVPGSAPSGYVELPKTSYINTETGEALKGPAESWVLGDVPFGASPSIFQGQFLGDRTTGGVGVEFTAEGAPVYFAEGYRRPSSWVKFREGILEPVTAAIVGAYLGPAAAATVRGLQTYHDTGSLGDAAKAAALSYAGSQVMGQLTGGSALDAGMGTYDVSGFSPPSGLDAGMGAYDVSGFNPPSGLDAGLGAYDFSGFSPPPDITSDLLQAGAASTAGEAATGAAGEAAAGTAGEAATGPAIDIGPDDFFGEPTLEELAQMGQPPAPPPTQPDLGYLNTGAAQEAAAAGTDTGPLDGSTSPILGDPTSVAGGTPIESVPGDPTSVAGGTPIEGMTPGETGLALGAEGAGDPYIASELAGSDPSSWDPSLLNSLTAFAATPLGKLALSLGGSALLNKVFAEQQGGGGGGPVGWSGEIPKYTAVRERVPLADTERRPGEYGRRYFSDTTYVPMVTGEESAETNLANIAAAKELAQQQAQGLASIPTRASRPVYTPKYMTNPTAAPADTATATATATGLPSLPTYENEPRLTYGLPSVDERLAATNFRTAEEERLGIPSKQLAASPLTAGTPPVRRAAGGLMGLAKGRYLNGTTDGMEDKLRTTIDGEQPAALSHGEFVIPADVVSHLGNGNSQAGAKRLYEMMDRIRQARTGTKQQGKQINANKYLPV